MAADPQLTEKAHEGAKKALEKLRKQSLAEVCAACCFDHATWSGSGDSDWWVQGLQGAVDQTAELPVESCPSSFCPLRSTRRSRTAERTRASPRSAEET